MTGSTFCTGSFRLSHTIVFLVLQTNRVQLAQDHLVTKEIKRGPL